MKKQTELKTESPKKTIFFLLWCFFPVSVYVPDGLICVVQWISTEWPDRKSIFFLRQKKQWYFSFCKYTHLFVCVCLGLNQSHSLFPFGFSPLSLSLVLMFFHQTISYFIVFIASNTFCSAWNKIYKWFLFPSTLPSMPSHSWHPSHFFARSLARLRSLCVFRWLHWRDASIS